jgi:N-methylhydantoinase A
MGVEDAALGILEVADAHMERAMRVITVERGFDPREYALLAFGGAGPLHAASLAQRLGIRRVLIPTAAGVLSALGMLTADLQRDLVRSFLRPMEEIEPHEIYKIDQCLKQEAETSLQSTTVKGIEQRLFVELRYRGQAYEIVLDLPSKTWRGGLSRKDLSGLEMRFHEEHRRLYGYTLKDHPTELVSLRLKAIGKVPKPELPKLEEGLRERSQEGHGRRGVYFAGEGRINCSIFAREALLPETEVKGPAILEGRESTVALPPGWSAQVDPFGNLILILEA